MAASAAEATSNGCDNGIASPGLSPPDVATGLRRGWASPDRMIWRVDVVPVRLLDARVLFTALAACTFWEPPIAPLGYDENPFYGCCLVFAESRTAV